MGFSKFIIVLMINYFSLDIYIYITLIFNFRAVRRNEKIERRGIIGWYYTTGSINTRYGRNNIILLVIGTSR